MSDSTVSEPAHLFEARTKIQILERPKIIRKSVLALPFPYKAKHVVGFVSLFCFHTFVTIK